MAVLAMKKISICAMKKDRKAVLEKLQSLGVVEVRTDGEENDVFKKDSTAAQRAKYEKRVQQTENALLILDQFAPVKTSMFAALEGKKDVEDDILEEIVANRGKYNKIVENIQNLSKDIRNYQSAIEKCNINIDGLKPWINMDIPINTQGTKTTSVLIGSMAPGLTEDMITEMVENRQEGLYYDVTVISEDKDQTCIFVICLKKDATKLEEALRADGFTRISYFSKRTPEGKIEKYKSDIKEHENSIKEAEDKLKNLADNREKLKILSDYYRIRAEKYNVLGGLLQSKSTFIVSGYILEEDADKIKDILNKEFQLMVETEDVPEEEQAPIKLRNPKAFASAEGVLASFGLPGKGEMDPTTPMCICYIFLFGLMLSDAAYGLIIFLACFILLKKFPKMGEGLEKSLRLFMYCGISTLFWGVLFGGYFGDLITVVSREFFHHEILIKPLWFAPLDNPMKMLVFSLLFGLIHLFLGLGLKGYMCLRDKDYVAFFCDVISWFMLIIGLILMLLPTELFASIAQMEFNFSPAVKTASKVLALAGLVIIILMSGRSKKNPALRIALGLYDVYNITGWLSDLLSYSRLLALGLATGVIAQVVNQMGSMAGDGIFGAIVFIVVFFIGHIFNLAINMLGAYVHTCRLQYVEFFGKFYEGGGEPFAPFKENTKYVEIKED